MNNIKLIDNNNCSKGKSFTITLGNEIIGDTSYLYENNHLKPKR